MSTRMQQRRGTASQWTISDPILAEGEFGWESDTNKFKIGDGVNNWSLLGYFEDSAAAGASLDDYVPLALLGVSDGVATLDSNGYVPVSQLGNILDAAPAALDTLNELAAALNDDANAFSTLTSYADQAEADAKAYADGLAANYDAAGSAATAESNAADYTDGEITTLEASLQSYTDTAVASAQPTFTNNFMLMGA